MSPLAQKVVIVTGASSGIGAATARHLGRAQAKVVLAGRNQAALATVAREVEALGGQALSVPTDVRDQAQCRALVAKAQARWSRVDGLVNNAGLGFSNPVGKLDADEVRAQLDTDLLGVIWLCDAVAPLMIAQRAGAIVNIGSVAGRIGLPTSSVYCAAKYGLTGFSQALRAELRPHGVGVSLLNPGFVATDFSRRAARGGPDDRPRPGPEMSADDVAAMILRLLVRPRREVVMTWPYRLATGLNRLAPALMDPLLALLARRLT